MDAPGHLPRGIGVSLRSGQMRRSSRFANVRWLIRRSGGVQNAGEFKIGLFKFGAYYVPQEQKHGASLQ
jgi:hypothetical protein